MVKTRAPTQNIRDVNRINEILEVLQQSDGVTLHLDETSNGPWQVHILAVEPGDTLRLELDRPSECKPLLDARIPFRLVGEAESAMVRTAPLALSEQEAEAGHARCFCTYPDALELVFRRDTFRADLPPGSPVPVELTLNRGGTNIRGTLKNLSLGGCLVEVPMAVGMRLVEDDQGVALDACFPNGQNLSAKASIRHVRPNEAWDAALVGCQFAPDNPSLERTLWHLAREVERQRAYDRGTSARAEPSKLFQAAPAFVQREDAHADAHPHGSDALSPALQDIVTSLDAQLLQIRWGDVIATKPLLRQSRLLIDRLDQNRDALFYEIAGISGQPGPVRHGLAVAARLAQLAIWHRIETERLAAVVACALIHDFGKALLPAAITQSRGPLGEEQRLTLATHVQALIDRLDDSTMLPSDIVAAVIAQANERLDGSGYPNRLRHNELPQLARMMAVADVADAMRQDRADRTAWPQNDVYRHLLQASDEFDNAWVRRYIKHFGLAPVGSLAKYAGGKLGWVRRLDDRSKPAEVEVVIDLAKHQPIMARSRIVIGNDLERLGQLECAVEPRAYGLGRGQAPGT